MRAYAIALKFLAVLLAVSNLQTGKALRERAFGAPMETGGLVRFLAHWAKAFAYGGEIWCLPA
jgi:hypothetical protein